MSVIRGEYTRLFWKTESTYGQEDGTGSWRRFGITHGATCPDPDYDYMPQWIAGEGRDWHFQPGDVRELYTGSIPDIWMQDGRLLKFLLGSLSTAAYGSYWKHTIITDITLPSFTWEVNDRDETGASTLVRRYLGCKVNRATLEATEGEILTCSLDEIYCQDLDHDDSTVSYKYNAALTATTTPTPLTYQPYLFHEGELQLYNTTFAQVKSFRLDINNSLEPKYYICDDKGSPIPQAIYEGRTGFRCSVTIDVVDNSIFQALLTKGEYSGSYKGFTGYLKFTRGGDANDYLKIGLGPTTAVSTVNPGCFLKSAPGKVVETPLITIDQDIEIPTCWFEVVDSLTAAQYA